MIDLGLCLWRYCSSVSIFFSSFISILSKGILAQFFTNFNHNHIAFSTWIWITSNIGKPPFRASMSTSSLSTVSALQLCNSNWSYQSKIMQASRIVYGIVHVRNGTERRRRHRSPKRRLPDVGCDPNSGEKYNIDLWLWLKLVKSWAKIPLLRIDIKLLKKTAKKMDTELQ